VSPAVALLLLLGSAVLVLLVLAEAQAEEGVCLLVVQGDGALLRVDLGDEVETFIVIVKLSLLLLLLYHAILLLLGNVSVKHTMPLSLRSISGKAMRMYSGGPLSRVPVSMSSSTLSP